MPGSQHLLGLIVVADFFRRADWEVVIEIGTSAETILETIQHEWFELIGLSVSTERECKALNSLLLRAREISRNPTIRVILGGPVFTSPMGTKAMEMAAEMGVLGCCFGRGAWVGTGVPCPIPLGAGGTGGVSPLWDVDLRGGVVDLGVWG